MAYLALHFKQVLWKEAWARAGTPKEATARDTRGAPGENQVPEAKEKKSFRAQNG